MLFVQADGLVASMQQERSPNQEIKMVMSHEGWSRALKALEDNQPEELLAALAVAKKECPDEKRQAASVRC
ncbi:MAG: hypothetical protein AB1331_10580 [Bacillota bacterium]